MRGKQFLKDELTSGKTRGTAAALSSLQFLLPGKLPAELLAALLSPLQDIASQDASIIQGPGNGLDCAVVDLGSTWLVLKTDPITFTADQIGWYAVQVNANDLATSGAQPRWFLATLLLPQESATPFMVEQIFKQMTDACRDIGALLIGGHTEVTLGLNRPILVGTLVGQVSPGKLISPRGAQTGDRLLLTKGVPIEATAILGRDLSQRLREVLSPDELLQAQQYLYYPGISVLRDAQIALKVGRVHAMHDPTEGGIVTALWELAEASEHSVEINLRNVYVPDLSRRICAALSIDPFASIASGALLLAVHPDDARAICGALNNAGIHCSEIGQVLDGPPVAWEILEDECREPLARPERDEIARLYEKII